MSRHPRSPQYANLGSNSSFATCNAWDRTPAPDESLPARRRSLIGVILLRSRYERKVKLAGPVRRTGDAAVVHDHHDEVPVLACVADTSIRLKGRSHVLADPFAAGVIGIEVGRLAGPHVELPALFQVSCTFCGGPLIRLALTPVSAAAAGQRQKPPSRVKSPPVEVTGSGWPTVPPNSKPPPVLKVAPPCLP